MTDNEIIKAIAELDGWCFVQNQMDGGSFGWVKNNCFPQRYDSLPNYLHSYDAIIPVVQKWCSSGEPNLDMVFFFYRRLKDMVTVVRQPNTTEIVNILLNATPAQLCEALLKSVVKWKE